MVQLLRVAVLTVFVPAAAQANAQLDRAVVLWLSGNDAQSLPMLAELAQAGHPDARMLLARIETTDLGPSPFRASLSAAQSRALFRQASGSRFGRSWLAVEAEAGNPLAQTLAQIGRPTPDLTLIERLHQFGEREAADHPIRILALYGSTEERRQLGASPFMLDDLIPYLDYLSGPPEPRGDGLSALRHIAGSTPGDISASDPDALGMAGLLALGYGFGDLSRSNSWRLAVEDWLLTAPSTRPAAALCARECPAEAGECAFAFLALLGGYYEIIRIDTPLETVVPQGTFLDSPRAQLMALRRASLARAETNLGVLAERSAISEISHCAAALVEEERGKYR